MNRNYTYSVCVASYNGEKYIKEQLNSILEQLTESDELIVSDDGSKDSTVTIVMEMQKQYPIIKVVKGPQRGFSCNFENAVRHATKDVIVFSDQDDIWIEGKIDKLDEAFTKDAKATTVLHTMSTFRGDEEGHEIPMGYHKGIFRNWLMSSYWGCCMAVKREFMLRYIPFRPYCVGHDQLTGLMTEKFGKNIFLPMDLIKHRLHETNTSFTQPLRKKIKFRVEMLKDYMYSKRAYQQNCK